MFNGNERYKFVFADPMGNLKIRFDPEIMEKRGTLI